MRDGFIVGGLISGGARRARGNGWLRPDVNGANSLRVETAAYLQSDSVRRRTDIHITFDHGSSAAERKPKCPSHTKNF